MRTFVMMALALSCFTARAGGIGFEKKYVGVHPFAGKTVTLEFTEKAGLSLSVAETIGTAEKLVLAPVSRNNFETVFELKDGEGRDATVVAKVVTTGDCQQVRTLALVYPSGVTAYLKAVPEAAEARPERPTKPE